MIQIDDAGSGSLLGGTLIGALRVETGEYKDEIIPLEYYQNENFNKKLYIQYVVNITERLFQKLDVSTSEEIQVCRGYMFDELNKWLKTNNYNHINTKIGDPLQSIIETSFDQYAISLGLPNSYISYTKYPFHFHRILKWVYADYEERSKLCKTGWKSWNKYKNIKLSTNHEIIKNRDWVCLKCNQLIPRNTTAAIKSYISNRHYKIYLHDHCI
ncbi:hypothetical protein SAMN03080606_03588 [Alkaliphilus peptidifermentans DSM 18978]|uniref:Uncharacterized protein n=1 Tax=Alkaliphilus peptidifermentans DSM 18978 TaxID=1120976 RepID=A0A1G5KLF4_9FIRM|nr:hypothetical protein [Alkaliphilus peptidifermentans]SCZ01426.1 hypothetical protein SAMN03080606_03588 [Alkaliphilus peptidifermentans DSM 18978]